MDDLITFRIELFDNLLNWELLPILALKTEVGTKGNCSNSPGLNYCSLVVKNRSNSGRLMLSSGDGSFDPYEVMVLQARREWEEKDIAAVV